MIDNFIDSELNLYIKENLILIKDEAKSNEEIIKKLGTLLYEQGFVKDTYIDAVLEREKVFPTGIATEVTGVAIPHTDSIHVNQSAIAIATLHTPITFEAMGYPGKIVDNVEIVILLALKDPKKVMDVIRLIMGVFTSEPMLNSLLDASSTEEIKQIFINEHK